MSAGVQTAVTLLLVLGAAAWLAVRAWRAVAAARRRGAGGCGPGCGCD